MNDNRCLGPSVACLLILAFTSTSYAEVRTAWCHDEGYFQHLKDDRWDEKSPGGIAHFVERERNEKFIELVDASRGCHMRLFNNHCDIRFQNSKFTKLYDGSWQARPPDFVTRVDSIVAHAGITANTPGVAVLVLEHGKAVFRKSYGLARLKDKAPITPQTTFELASCSKQFTGTAILLLYEQGKHPKFLSNEDYVSLFARQHKKFPPYFQTGSEWRYTNTNYMLLALIVERITKQSFGTFVKKEIFDPLWMKTATVNERPNVTPHAPALGYHKDKTRFEETWGAAPFRHETHLEVGDGAVWASLDDLARWNAGWRQGKILKPATEKLALVPSKYGDGQTTDYAFGWGVAIENGKLQRMSHNGSWGGFLTYVDRNVADDRTLIVLCNVDSLNVDAIVRTCRAMPPQKMNAE